MTPHDPKTYVMYPSIGSPIRQLEPSEKVVRQDGRPGFVQQLRPFLLRHVLEIILACLLHSDYEFFGLGSG